jgi:legumain
LKVLATNKDQQNTPWPYHGPAAPPSPSTPPTPGEGTNWVVIAAGSKTYGNYRHQADACHAYQVVKKGGVPASNIIVMMEDDVASSPENPFPGKMFNKPTAAGEAGVDVYDGCEIDYRGNVVTAKLFLDVLQGNSDEVDGMGSGKVLKSGPNDKVFINFVDHGGTGIIEFPNGDFLHATDLNKALTNMASQKMFDKLVFYMEACESGSMFQNLLPTDINVFATTAANAQESSWGTYCPPDDKVNGKELNSCLGDLYSVNWLEDADTATGMARTLEGQYEQVKKLTNKSHVMEYGTLSFDQTDKVGDYLAPNPSDGADNDASDNTEVKRPSNVVDTHDIELLQDFYKYLRADSQGKTSEEKQALAEELVAVIQARQEIDAKFANMLDVVASFEPDLDSIDAIDGECVKASYTAFQETCGVLDTYSLKYSHQIADLCTSYTSDTISTILATMCE